MIIGKADIQTALREVPFTIHMADGRDYRVANERQIHIARNHIVFIDERVIPHMLPLLTITGITFGNTRKARK